MCYMRGRLLRELGFNLVLIGILSLEWKVEPPNVAQVEFDSCFDRHRCLLSGCNSARRGGRFRDVVDEQQRGNFCRKAPCCRLI